jgi:hypothetical protein
VALTVTSQVKAAGVTLILHYSPLGHRERYARKGGSDKVALGHSAQENAPARIAHDPIPALL